MKLTVKDILGMEVMKDVKIIAGHGGLEREVRAVNIIEVPDVERWLKESELLFSSGYAFQGDGERGARLLEKLNGLGISGLVIKPGKYLKTIPATMIECADLLKFPLLEIPEDNPYSMYTEAIYATLLNNRTLLLENLSNLHEYLLYAVLDDGLEGLCKALYEKMNQSVYLLNYSCEVEICQGYYYKWIQKAVLNHIKKGGGDTGNFFRFHYIYGGTEHYFACKPVYLEKHLRYYLVMHSDENVSNEFEPLALRYASTLVSMEMLKQKALLDKENMISGELLSNLIDMRYDDEEVMFKRGKLLNIDLHLPFVVASVMIQHTSKKYNDQEKNKKHLGTVKNQLRDLINQHIAASGKSFILLEKSRSLVALMNNTQKEDIQWLQRKFEYILNEVQQSYKQFQFFAGLGKIHSGMENVPKSYNESSISAKIGINMASAKFCQYFDDLGAHRILYDLKDSKLMQSFYREKFQFLLDYDHNNKTELIKTIRAYYLCNGNVAKTAEYLFIHKNSVTYRLKKAESLVGKKLSDFETALELQLCIKYSDIQ